MRRTPAHLSILLLIAGIILGGCAKTMMYNPPAPAAETIRPAPTNQVPTLARSPLSQYYIPPYYDPNYLETVEASRTETELVIYADFDRSQWKSVVRVFNRHYPWVKIKIINPPTSPFEQYNSEITQRIPSADIIISTDTISWFNLLLRGEVMAYQSQESLYLPLWATKYSGLYPISLDPAVTVYYRNLVSTPPITMQALNNIIRRAPNIYQQRIITLNPETNSEAFLVNWFWIKAKGETGWELLGKIGQTQPLLADNKNDLMSTVISGAARIGYFVPASSVLFEKARYTNLEFSYLRDNQPLFMNYLGITQAASHPNAAKLLLDFLLSQDGQIALSQDGMLPYRSDVAEVVDYHLDRIEQDLGASSLVFIDIEPILSTKPATVEDFLKEWQSTYGRLPVTE